MKEIFGKEYLEICPISFEKYYGQKITLKGTIHKVRKLGGLLFIILRSGKYFTQCKLEKNSLNIPDESYNEGNYVAITGICQIEKRAKYGVEIQIESIKILSIPDEKMPFSINNHFLDISMDTNLDFRPISLRHQKESAIFSIQSAIASLFRESLFLIGFTEIHSPKLVFAGAEGGSNVFKVEYFNKKLFLAQSPQFYKQMMVGVFGRVMEIGPVFRAEPHDTSRHLNEYTSMDLEMGPIEKFEEIMEIETYLLNYIFEQLPKRCAYEINELEIEIPKINKIPAIKMSEALGIVKTIDKTYKKNDLDPNAEKIVCQYIFEKTGSELVFVTHFPKNIRPFYTMEDPKNPNLTLSFDLLFRGLEITTGGQRIHDYRTQKEKIKSFGYDPKDFMFYLQIHKYGMPPHGGLGLGLERLTMQILKLSNIKNACLFPRTMKRIIP